MRRRRIRRILNIIALYYTMEDAVLRQRLALRMPKEGSIAR